MKKASVFFGFSAIILGASASLALAAGLALTNGGLGQTAANPQQFGVAVCAGSGQALSASVPMTISVGSQNANITSASSIAAGTCQYSYIPYSQLSMQAGQTYSVNVTIDPQHSVISNSNNTATYSVTVPSQTAAANNNNLTADASDQLSNPFLAIWNWFIDLFSHN
jgi:hypothetical protein